MSLLKTAGNLRATAQQLADKSLTVTASFNAIASALDYVARVVVEFLINPYLVAGLGDYVFGLWRIAWRLIGYMQAAGGRSAQALKWAVANDQSGADHDHKRALVGSAIVVWLLFLPLLATLGALFAWQGPAFFEVDPAHIVPFRLTIGLLALNTILLSLADVPRAVLQGENLGYKRMGLSTGLVLLSGLLMAGAVYLGWGLVGVAASTVVVTVLTGVLFALVVRSYVPWFGVRRPTRALVRWFFGLSGWFLVWKVVNQLMTSGDILVLGAYGSVSLVTPYTLSKYVPDAMIRLVAIFVFGIAPGLGGIIGAGRFPKARRVRAEIMSITWLLATVAGVAILLLNRAFVSLWVGPQYDAGGWETFLIVVMVTQLTLIRNDANVIDLTLDVRRKVLLGLVSTLISLGTAAWLLQQFDAGILGLCAGIIGGRLILTLAYPWQVGRFLQIPFRDQLRAAVRPGLTLLLFLLLARQFRAALPVQSWFDLLLWSAVLGLLLPPLAAFAGLTGQQRRRLWQRVAGLSRLVQGGGPSA